MAENYFLGVLCAILAGVIASSGNILQKKAVNDMSKEKRNEKFMRTLLKSPTWIIGSLLCYVVSSIFLIFAQYTIGPALITGLFASGLIVLAIGSIKLIGEKLKIFEFVGIFLMVAAIVFLGFSELDIPAEEINVFDSNLMARVGIFSGILIILWIITSLLSKRDIKQKGVALTIAGGYLFGLANFWVFFLLVSITLLFGGFATIIDVLVFAISIVIIAFGNVFAIKQTQESYKFIPVSISQPTQEIPKQVLPVFIYFSVFLKTAPAISMWFVIIGSILVIVSGFLLGQRQAELDKIDKQK